MDKSGERTAHPFRQFKSGFRPPLPSPVSRFPFPVSRFPFPVRNDQLDVEMCNSSSLVRPPLQIATCEAIMRALYTFLAVSLAAAPVAAQGWIEPRPAIPMSAVAKVRTSVSVRVTGRIAQVEVEEWFENRGGRLGEAVFSNFSLFQGDQELRGETMDADRARAIYEEIVRRKKDPALIELVGHGLIRARVFPINPGETRKITLRYTQMMDRAGDALQFQYAAGGTTTMRPQSPDHQPGPRRVLTDVPVSFRLTADSAAAFRDPFSPTHEVRVRRDDGILTVRPENKLSGDFVLFLPFARETVGITVATHRPPGEDGYFMLTLSPGEVRGSTLPRDITAVVDISGSMSGEKLEQAKAALRQLVSTLGSRDRFRLVAFSSRVQAQSGRWSRATANNLRDARSWIDGLDANGGTNIEGALSEAFRLESNPGRIPMVIFLTDGLPSVGEENPERLAEMAGSDRGDTRVFAFGVGYDVNTYLLDRLSDAGRGTTQYVRPGEDVEDAVGQLVAKVRHPVLADLGLVNAPVEFVEVYPERLPDLFAGEELVVFGRYQLRRGDRTGDVVVSGRRNNREERFSARIRFPEEVAANDFIPRLWASRKIGYLSRSVRLNGANEELIEEIRETALRYGLLSEFTSYLVQEPMAVAEAGQPGRGMASVGGVRMDVVAASAPAEAKGAAAVNTAEQQRARRQARSKMELEEADKDLLRLTHGPNTRHVAGRLFVEDNGLCTDLMHGDSLEVVEIEAFSNAYFLLLERAPELQEYFKELGHVLLAGATVSIKVSDTGVDKMTPLEVARLVEEFRGR
jgi:Ca-activated chloride channel family protein